MLWCTGLGSNSLTGSPKRSTNGCATYTYRCHPLLTTNPGQFWGQPPQFLFVIGLDAGQLGYSLKTEGNGPVSQLCTSSDFCATNHPIAAISTYIVMSRFLRGYSLRDA